MSRHGTYDLKYGFIPDADCPQSKPYTNMSPSYEDLLKFAHFVARETIVSDEEWEMNNNAFPELAARKLYKLGIIESDQGHWHYDWED